jgi:hypothetical protein
MNSPDDLRAIAKRMVWFKTPEDALKYPKVFLAHVMTYGTLDDLIATAKYYSDADFEAALDDPPAGIFDRRSWNYWNLRYDREPVPPLPRRKIPGVDRADFGQED